MEYSLLCSSKFFDDHVFNNSQWANIGGGTAYAIPLFFTFVGIVSPREMNNLEREFLILLDYSLFVTTDAYVQVWLSFFFFPLIARVCVRTGV